MTQLVTTLIPEQTVENEWFKADFVRQPDQRLLAHIKYHKWSPTAKKKTKDLMDSFDEPLFIFIHDTHHLKYVSSLGFKVTGRFVTCDFPGKEGLLFPEAVYTKDSPEKLYLTVYQEEKDLLLPKELVDGYGKIEEVEAKLRKLDQVKWETKHYFSDGVYTRETFVPAGSMLTGYRHKQRTVSMLVKGTISVIGVDELGYATDYGVLEAPMIFVTEAGIKKIGFAHEDVLFINSFAVPQEFCTEEKILELEDFIFEKELPCQELQLLQQ